MTHHTMTMIAASRADDIAYDTLNDVCAATASLNDTRIVGGHMTSLLLHVFPVEGIAARRTADADAAVSIEIASHGQMDRLLRRAGYEGTVGNHYERAEPDTTARAIDLLVPARDGAFRPQVIGGRGFDAAPGLRLALAAEPVSIDVTAALTDGRILTFTARVPPVEHATILKAYAFRDRTAAKDLSDLYSLLMIARAHRDDPAPIGGWCMNDPQATGSRRDAAAILHRVADTTATGRLRAVFSEAEVPPETFTFLVRALAVAPPAR